MLFAGPAPYLLFRWGIPAGWAAPAAWQAGRPVVLALAAALVLGAARALALRAGGGFRGDRATPSGTLLLALFAVVVASLLPLNARVALLTLTAAIGFAGWALFVSGLPAGAGAGALGLWGRLARMRRGPFLALAFVTSLALHLAVGWAAFGFRASIPDSLDQLFQARLFLSGRLTAPAPPEPDAFRFLYMAIDRGRWYSQYPPGHPVLLAAGLVLHATPLVVPLLGSLGVLVLYALAREASGEAAGRLAALLGTLSAFWNLMCGELLSHVPTALFLMLFVWLFLRARHRGSAVAGLLSGLAWGWAANVRPLTAAALAAAVLGWNLVARGAPARRRLAAMLLVAPGAVLGLGVLLWYNQATNGHPLVFGYQVTQGPLHRLGFGVRRMNDEVIDFTPLIGAEHTAWHLGGLGLFGLGSPVPLWVLAFLPFLRRRRTPAERLFLWLALVTPAVHFFYPFTDTILGPRLVFESLPFLLALAARGLADGPPAAVRLRAPGAAALALLLPAALVRLPSDTAFNAILSRLPQARVLERLPPDPPGPALALVSDFHFGIFGFGRLTPDLDRPVIWALDRGPLNLPLARAFPGRTPYLLRERGGRLAFLRVTDPVVDLVALRRGGGGAARGVEATTVPLEGRDWEVLYATALPASVTFPVTAPAHAWLLFSPFPIPGSGAVVDAVVEAREGPGAPRVLARRRVAALAEGQVVTLPPQEEVELAPFAGRAIELTLRAEPAPGHAGGGFVWVHPRVAAWE
jgi:hypothetical protein